MMHGGELHMWAMYGRANAYDKAEGLAAYARYHHVLRELSLSYGVSLERVAAVFASLSPNSDYIGNLRSTVSVLHGAVSGHTIERIQVATYRHCLERAWQYLHGTADFLETTKGPKIRAFYHNILDPTERDHVTVDGHMVAIWSNKNLKMKDALPYLRGGGYERISKQVKAMALDHGIVPCQMQAILWHTRKRLLNIKHTDQQNLWPHDEPNMLEPYPERLVGPQRAAHDDARVSDIRGRQCANLGSGEPGRLPSLHQASLAL